MSDMSTIELTSQGIPLAPSDRQWKELVASKQELTVSGTCEDSVVDIVIPVYQGIDETLACIFSAVSTTLKDACEIIVINDGSPEPALVEALERWAQKGLFTLIHNEQNFGFVRTVNRGMALHGDRDVILLNSDAIVYGNWLARMRQAVASASNVGTVTPLSNNAEICSYPEFVKNNQTRLEVDDDHLDLLAAQCNESHFVEVPTGVGFCMYIRRACLDVIGNFDEKKFGKGYGEENDFCLRARSKGWVHLLATNIFVRHCGGVSFGDGKDALVLQGLRVLARDWPKYDGDIQKFLAADPVFPARRALDAARVIHSGANQKTMLFVTHEWGGGIERHIQNMIGLLRSRDIGVLVMRAPRGHEGCVAFEHSAVIGSPNLRYRIKEEYPAILALLNSMSIFHVHVHSFAGYALDAGSFISTLSAELGVAYDFTVHDYLAWCPRVTMIDGSGVYCGDPSEEVCTKCIAKNGAPVPVDSIPKYRQRYREFLEGARQVFAPDRDAKLRFEKWFPFLHVQIRPHLQDYAFQHPIPVRYQGAGILRVAIIGAIGPHKGSTLLLECARDAERRQLPIRFVIFGITDKAELDAHPLVTVKGAYVEGAVGSMLKEHRCHLSFFSSVWPETWSYTLSEALDAGLFPVAFDLGAIAQRIRHIGWGYCLPMSAMTNPAVVNDALLAQRPTEFSKGVREQIKAGETHYADPLQDYYGLGAQ